MLRPSLHETVPGLSGKKPFRKNLHIHFQETGKARVTELETNACRLRILQAKRQLAFAFQGGSLEWRAAFPSVLNGLDEQAATRYFNGHEIGYPDLVDRRCMLHAWHRRRTSA